MSSALLNVVRVSDVTPEVVTWLWRGRIPRKGLTAWDGDPGMGKTTLLLDIAGRVSAGLPMPDGTPSGGPADVLILTVEDEPAATIRPRLEAAKADLDRVHIITGVPVGGAASGYNRLIEGNEAAEPEERPVTLPDDWPAIAWAVEQTGAKLLILDPLMALLGTDTNSYRDQDIRRALVPGIRVAERFDFALVVTRHLNKGMVTKALYRGGGSIGLIAAARSGLLVAPDPTDDTGERRVLAMVKHNLAARASSLSYTISETTVSNGVPTTHINWGGTIDFDANDLLDGASKSPSQVISPERQQIIDFLDGSNVALAPQQIADRLDKPVSTVRNLLRSMDNNCQVVRPQTGIYTTPNHRCLDSIDSVDVEPVESTESMNLSRRAPVDSDPVHLDHIGRCHACGGLTGAGERLCQICTDRGAA